MNRQVFPGSHVRDRPRHFEDAVNRPRTQTLALGSLSKQRATLVVELCMDAYLVRGHRSVSPFAVAESASLRLQGVIEQFGPCLPSIQIAWVTARLGAPRYLGIVARRLRFICDQDIDVGPFDVNE